MGESAAASSLSVGTMLAETYRVTRLLGRGGMGSVWEAEHERLPGKKVAIKVLHAEVADDNESLLRFRREAEIASRLGHPNIVDVHDFNILPSGAPYLVLEFLEGEDLAERLARGPMALDEVASIVRQIGSALQAAHQQNIVHRDLKPQNVFLLTTEAGEFAAVQAKVLDFGISKIRGSQTIKTNASDMLGTPQYMAPEQATGQHDAIDGRTDVFALGAMVYEMLSGVPAFPGRSIPEVVFKVVYEDPTPLGELAQVPPGVADAIHQALAKKQEERFEDISKFVEALTGSPLNTLRTGAVIARPDGYSAAAPTNQAVGSNDAVAATIDSGRAAVDDAFAGTVASGKAPLAASASADGLAGTVASGKAPIAPSAPADGLAGTVASSKAPLAFPAPAESHASTVASVRAPVAADLAGEALAETVDSSKKALLLPSPSRIDAVADTAALPAAAGGRGWLGLGLIAIAGAAVAVTLILKSGDGATSSSSVAAGATAVATDAATTDHKSSTATTATSIPDAGLTAAAKQPRDAGAASSEKLASRDGTKPRHKPPRGATKKKNPGDKPRKLASQPVPPAVLADIARANAMLRAGRPRRALTIAMRANRAHRTDKASALITRTYCHQHDLGMAVSTFKHVKNKQMRDRVMRYCAGKSIDLAP